MKKAFLIDLIVLRPYIKQLGPVGVFVALCMALGMGTPVAIAGTFVVLFALMSSMSANAYDDLNGWGAYRLTLPVSRRDVVLGRYLTVAALAVLGGVIGAAMEAVLWALANVVPLPDMFAGLGSMGADGLLESGFTVCACLVFAAFVSSAVMPVFFKFGTTKATQFLPFISMGVAFLIAYAVSQVDGTVVAQVSAAVEQAIANGFAPFALGCVVLSALMLCLSATLSVRIYSTREL